MITTRALLRTAGLLMWGFAGIPAAINIARAGEDVSPGSVAAWIGAFVVFGFAFFRASRRGAPEGNEAVRLLAVQTLAALAMNSIFCTGFEVGLLVVVAVELGLVLRLSLAIPWLVAQSIIMLALAVVHMGDRGLVWAVGVTGAEAFAFTVAAMAGRELAARRKVEATNAELEATRASLAEATRDAERLRIARELHDLLGHDLVALHLELETARHLTPKLEPLDRAHDVARQLLTDLRLAVSRLRDDGRPIDVAAHVQAVVARVQGPSIHVDLPKTLAIRDAERANAIVRFVQEAVTNAIKHAEAKNVWIALTPGDRSVELSAKDDGNGARNVAPGHGLSGMRERFERLGGAVHLRPDEGPGSGFHLRATLPLEDRP